MVLQSSTDRHKEADLLDVKTEKGVKALRKRISSPRFLGMLRVGDKAVVNQMKSNYSLEYPLMIGSAILFESKLLTADYIFTLYDKLQGTDMELHPCFYDTDSCCISIKNFKKHYKSIDEFTYKFNKEEYVLFDTSDNIPEYQMPETHSILGCMTNETKNKEITHFAGVASKCYSYKTADDSCTKGKGISRALQKDYLNFALYQSVVDGSIFDDFSRDKFSVKFNEFKADKFNIETRSMTKQYITLVDLKSYYGTNSGEYAIFGSEKHFQLLEEDNNSNYQSPVHNAKATQICKKHMDKVLGQLKRKAVTKHQE
jgi:hypothetical protein